MWYRVCIICLAWIGWVGTPALATEAEVVTEYEKRLEEIAAEIQAIRSDLEALVEELAEPEVGRVFIFLAAAPAQMRDLGATLVVDDQTVFSRPFTPAEQDVLDRGLPLELVELRLLEGVHAVEIHALDGDPTEPESFDVKRGELISWLALVSASGVTWQRD